jgi:ubiquinone/menaquinone biosynthesis C-methylase UbiE
MSKRTANGVVYGIDYSELAFANSEKENRKEISIKKVKILKASVSNIPFNDETFDLVTAFETIYFWPNLKSDLKEILRVLKDGGNILIVCEMFKGKDKNQEHQGIVDLLKIDKNYLSKEELKEMVLSAGFNNVKVKVDEDKKWIAVLAKK